MNIPKILIYSRLFISVIIITLAYYQPPLYPYIIVSLLTIGLLTDIFDGIIARKLNISTTSLRRLDSTIDQIFFVCTAIASYMLCPNFYKANALYIGILVGAEILIYLVSYLKFQKEVATHSLGAKFWTLILFATLIEIFLTCNSTVLFQLCIWIGIITRFEIVLIILVLKNWTNDVPTLYHAIQLRKGKSIKRNKLFNG